MAKMVFTNDNYIVAASIKFSTPVEEIVSEDVRTVYSVVEKNRVDLWDCFDELVAYSTNPTSQTLSDHNPREKEVSTFLAIPLVAKDECPFPIH